MDTPTEMKFTPRSPAGRKTFRRVSVSSREKLELAFMKFETKQQPEQPTIQLSQPNEQLHNSPPPPTSLQAKIIAQQAAQPTNHALHVREMDSMLKMMGYTWDLHDVQDLLHEMNHHVRENRSVEEKRKEKREAGANGSFSGSDSESGSEGEEEVVTLSEFLHWFDELDPNNEQQSEIHSKIMSLLLTSVIENRTSNKNQDAHIESASRSNRRPLFRLAVGWLAFWTPSIFRYFLGIYGCWFFMVAFAIVHYQFKYVIWTINSLKGSMTLDRRTWVFRLHRSETEKLESQGNEDDGKPVNRKTFSRSLTQAIEEEKEAILSNDELFLKFKNSSIPLQKKHLPINRIFMGSLTFIGVGVCGMHEEHGTLLAFTLGTIFGVMHFTVPHMIRMMSGIRGHVTIDPQTWKFDIANIQKDATFNKEHWIKLFKTLKPKAKGD